MGGKCGKPLFEHSDFVANGNAWMDGLQKIHSVRISFEQEDFVKREVS